MFKLFKNFSGEWILVPYDSPGLTIVAVILVALLGVKFFVTAGPAIIMPILLAFIVPFLLAGICDKLHISRYWLCILHCYFIQRFIDVIAMNDINGNPEGLGLINIILLFMFLVIGCGELIFLGGDGGFPVFFVITITNALYYLSTAIYKIAFVDKLVLYSFGLQIIMGIISQIVVIYNWNKTKNSR